MAGKMRSHRQGRTCELNTQHQGTKGECTPDQKQRVGAKIEERQNEMRPRPAVWAASKHDGCCYRI